MRKTIFLIAAAFFIFSLTVFGSTKTETKTETFTKAADETKDMQKIELVINDKTFTADLYDNETTRSFAAKLPFTLGMHELNGNEKYHYFSEDFPENTKKISSIYEGDLMLFGSNCLVLFYEEFSTSYSYTQIGKISDTSGLKEALGTGDVTVTFQIKK